ncbi:MAG: hypothetical protein RQ826_06485 [Xanthomonadales bacterium]|nr:hypothetical protein [Xanthomonadales bacterium]
MGWSILYVRLDIEPRSIQIEGPKAVARVNVRGRTDETDEVNSYRAFLREDYIMPDTIWKSEEVPIGPNREVDEVHEVEIWCNRFCNVVGPHGSTHESKADIYAVVQGGELEGQSDQVAVSCSK